MTIVSPPHNFFDISFFSGLNTGHGMGRAVPTLPLNRTGPIIPSSSVLYGASSHASYRNDETGYGTDADPQRNGLIVVKTIISILIIIIVIIEIIVIIGIIAIMAIIAIMIIVIK